MSVADATGSSVDGRRTDEQEEKLRFLKRFPKYGYDGRIDSIYEKELKSRVGDVAYLDWTAASLYLNSQIDGVSEELKSNVFGNPHSANPSSQRTTEAVEQLRSNILKHFNGDPDEYIVVFTRSATGALHAVGESFPYSSGSSHIYTRSNHNSVLGIREYAHARGAKRVGATEEAEVERWLAGEDAEPHTVSPTTTPTTIITTSATHTTTLSSSGATDATAATIDASSAQAAHNSLLGRKLSMAEAGASAGISGELRSFVLPAASAFGADASAVAGDSIDVGKQQRSHQQQEGASNEGISNEGISNEGSEHIKSSSGSSAAGQTYSLFAYPAYDNYCGVIYPLRWIEQLHAKSTKDHRWLVLLDSAAFVPHHKLDLSVVKPDFFVISFYKVFGYPTGVGALVARRDALEILDKTYWGGGAVFTAASTLPWHMPLPQPEHMEDGSLPFLDIIALRHGFKMFSKLGGIEAIEGHVQSLGQYLYEQLTAIKHSNGAPVVQVWGKWPEQIALSPADTADDEDEDDRRVKHRHLVQGPTANFLILKPDGTVFSYLLTQHELASNGLQVRSGCTCNPGTCYNRTGITEQEVMEHATKMEEQGVPFSAWEWIYVSRPGQSSPVKRPLGSLRASLGFLSRFEDVYAFVRFIRTRYVDRWDDAHNYQNTDVACGP